MTKDDPLAAPAAVPVGLQPPYRPADRYAFLQSGATRLRYAWWNAVGTPRGTVLILPGRLEFIEKYATEVVGELLSRGFAVVGFDWRGQGLSDRPLPDSHKGHIDRFETYLTDLSLFLDTVLIDAPRPVIGLCHSMGGHLFLRSLAQNGSGPFAGGIVTAPMMGLKRQALLRNVIRLTPPFQAVDRHYLFGTGAFQASKYPFAGNVLTHDERRFRFTADWFEADPRLCLGGPTIGWCRQALRSMTAALAPGMLERIDLPILLVSAAQDDLVDPASHPPVVARLRQGELLTIAGCRHEVLMETDDIRAQFWVAFDRMAKEICG
ncbi:alpha/beta fold hydrolase [Enhydrobacter aerosaccus]|nr:alpha/beta hydrolase [Enhydrobacter aerosaccus]